MSHLNLKALCHTSTSKHYVTHRPLPLLPAVMVKETDVADQNRLPLADMHATQTSALDWEATTTMQLTSATDENCCDRLLWHTSFSNSHRPILKGQTVYLDMLKNKTKIGIHRKKIGGQYHKILDESLRQWVTCDTDDRRNPPPRNILKTCSN